MRRIKGTVSKWLEYNTGFISATTTKEPIYKNLLNNNYNHGDGSIFSPQSSLSQLFVHGLVDRLARLLPNKRFSGTVRSEAEEKVHKWLHTLAQTEINLAFEYVSSTERGLSFKEADRRLAESGPNKVFDDAYPRWWQLLWRAFFHPFNMILLVLGALAYITSDSWNGSLMLVLVLISVSLRFYQEFSSSKAAMKLSELLKTPARVQRCAGESIQTELIVQIDQRGVVTGDIIHISTGDLFPGDVRLISSKDLVVSQSSLTGESGVVEKVADLIEEPMTPLLDLRNICLMGTSVASGWGTGLVVSTGSKTYMSTIFSTLGRRKTLDAFERGVRNVSWALICFMLLMVPIVFLVDYLATHNWASSILFSISVAVALTPQMLPLIVNTNLAKGALAMARDRCIVKNVVAVQNMGAMDILCMDKTGTLTMDCVILSQHIDAWGVARERVLRFAFLNAYYKSVQKNPIDDAILSYAYSKGYRFESSKWLKIDEIPFDFTRRRATMILETKEETNFAVEVSKSGSNRYLVVKGAPEEVLSVCSFVDDMDSGIVLPITPGDRLNIQKLSDELSNEGLRVLGVGIKGLVLKSKYGESDESDMIFLGFLTFYDPPKDTVKQALWCLAEKGVKAKVLTGDSLPLAVKVCKEVGIRTTNTITGSDLELLDPEQFHETVKKMTVLARLTPTQKLRVVQSLMAPGDHVVGFLGDGINDSLALEAADVGISVDSGASVAKDMADIVLLEKDLNVLVAGVERGRITYGNTVKYIKMAFVANLGSVVSLLIACVYLPFEPLTPMQLLTQNLLYNIGQILIPWDKMEEEYVRTSHTWSAKDIIFFMLWNGPVSTICDVTTFVFLCWYYKANEDSQVKFFHSAWFVEGLLMQTLIIHNIRTEKIPFVQATASWPLNLSTIMVSAVGIAFPFTPVGKVMGMVDLPLSYFGFLVLVFLFYFCLGQLVKKAYIFVFKKWL